MMGGALCYAGYEGGEGRGGPGGGDGNGGGGRRPGQRREGDVAHRLASGGRVKGFGLHMKLVLQPMQRGRTIGGA